MRDYTVTHPGECDGCGATFRDDEVLDANGRCPACADQHAARFICEEV